MSGSLCTSAMFTIEQIELIRRLRNSGITKEQVVHAFDSFNRLDQELGSLYNVPTSLAPPTQSQGYMSQMVTSQVPTAPVQIRTQYTQSLAPFDGTRSRVKTAASHLGDQPRHTKGPQPNFTSTVQTCSQERPAKRLREESLDLEDNATSCSFEDEQDNASTGSREEFTDELREFMKLGPEKMHDEIGNFLGRYDLKPSQVAAMTGLTSPQIHRYLQNYRDLPDKMCQAIYSWFVAYTNTVTPNPLGQGVSNTNLTPATRVKMPDGQEVLVPHTPKRERFTFREKHLEVLESCFKDNPYPSFDQREAIAHMCNMAVSNMGTRQLAEREKVTSPVVQNWFSNRRKEIKKIARDEGVDASANLLPSRIKVRVGGENFPSDLEYSEQTDKEQRLELEEAAVSHAQAILALSGQDKTSSSKVKKELGEMVSREQT